MDRVNSNRSIGGSSEKEGLVGNFETRLRFESNAPFLPPVAAIPNNGAMNHYRSDCHDRYKTEHHSLANRARAISSSPKYREISGDEPSNIIRKNAASSARLPISMPTLERPVSPPFDEETAGFRGDQLYRDPSGQRRSLQQDSVNQISYRELLLTSRADLKKPPPNHSSPRNKVDASTKPNPDSFSLETAQRFKTIPPPSCSDRLPSKTEEQSKKKNSRIRARPSSKLPANVPRAIDVDLSLNKFYYEKTGDTQLPTPPPLSPISFSSSMFQKTVHYYPSRERIEKVLSGLTPIESVFDDDPPAANKNHATPAGNERERSRAREQQEVPAVDTAVATRHDRMTRTAQPSSEESTQSVFRNRPEKPMRINSQFPSQLQLQKQRQQQEQQQQQQQSNPRHKSASNAHFIPMNDFPSPQPLPKGNAITNGIATRIGNEHLAPQQQRQQDDDDALSPQPNKGKGAATEKIVTRTNAHILREEEIPFPQPLPRGNGVTNGIATRIDAGRNFVPSSHQEEYDLQLSPQTPPTTPHSPQTNPNPVHQDTHSNANETTTNNKESDRIPPQPAVVQVEIYPGMSMDLRGAQETSNAHKRNFVVKCKCLVCTLQCSCIADAAFVICPGCFVVNPLDEKTLASNNRGSTKKVQYRWGVGLGYIPETKFQ